MDPKKPKPCRSTKKDVERKLSPPKIFKQKPWYKIHDPVRYAVVDDKMVCGFKMPTPSEFAMQKPTDFTIRPGIPIRKGPCEHPDPLLPIPPYVVPKSAKWLREAQERRLKAELERNFTKCGVQRMPSPYKSETIGTMLRTISPDISSENVRIRPKEPSGSALDKIPSIPEVAELNLRKPKSGIYVNQEAVQDLADEKDSFDLVYEHKPRPKRPGDEDELEEKELSTIDERAERIVSIEEEPTILTNKSVCEEDEEPLSEMLLQKLYRKKVSTMSVGTSLHSKSLGELAVYSDQDLQAEPYMSKIVQKFRRDSEAERYKPKPRKIVRGTLESHSFTKLKQPITKDFYYGVVVGTCNCCDFQFSEEVRGKQGMCIPVAAYCYAMLMHPNKWTELVVDDILRIGTRLYTDSIEQLHLHLYVELQHHQLAKYCAIERKKLLFQVFEPELVGQIRSCDKKVYNISKALQVFFKKHRAGIVRSCGLNVVVWKDKHYYLYDGSGRTKDLHADCNGGAILAHVYDISDLATIFLKFSNLGNNPFTISKVSVNKIMGINDECDEEDAYDVRAELSNYNVIDETKAVVLGSFDLADICFDFSRNKQAIAIVVVCLVYTRVTPPSAWHRRTLDKIMIIGNQFYLELVESKCVNEMTLDDIPALFTIGPYVVEILIYSNIYSDRIVKKGVCVLQKCLEKFFTTNTMALVVVDQSALAVWMQRDMFYCYDPYARNAEGLKSRNGNACVSMNSTVESVADVIAANFSEPCGQFVIHALKVVKIHRDPVTADLFPKTIPMDEISSETLKSCRMRKSKKKALVKFVTVEMGDGAVKQINPCNDFLSASIIDVSSDVDSITKDQMPPMKQKASIKPCEDECHRKLIDLDSPSLSDTQIEPERPEPNKDDVLNLSSWELTMDELELQEDEEEGEGEDRYVCGGGEDDELESYMTANQYAQVRGSLGARPRTSAQVNTDITVGFLPIAREILPPTDVSWKTRMLKQKEMEKRRQMMILQCSDCPPVITQSTELAKESNFVDLPDNSQIILGSCDISAFGSNVHYMAPYVCMMASAVAQKYTLNTWSHDVIDYTLRSGAKLYSLSKVRYDQVPILDVPKVSLGRTKFNILTEYLHDSVMKLCVLEETLTRVLFRRYDCGIVATPTYACTVFFKNCLFYLFECLGCNEIGLGVGTGKGGVACLARFKNVHDMAKRIIYNKTRRNDLEEFEFTRFVISACTSRPVATKTGLYVPKEEDAEDVEEEEEKNLRQNRIGYQLNDHYLTLQGSKALKDRKIIDYDDLKPDHFVCLCACLLLLNFPILRWDTNRVDYVLDQGYHVFKHADNLAITEKRIIRNVLIYQHFFDVIVNAAKLPDGRSGSLKKNLECITSKRDYVLLQFPNCCYAIYKHNSYYHVFDPYPCLPNGSIDEEDNGKAGWTIFNSLLELCRRIKKQIVKDGEHFIFYTFEVTSVSKAPKSLIVSQKLLEYEMEWDKKPEKIACPFNENDVWLLKDPVPWSRILAYNTKKVSRLRLTTWNRWEIEIPNDLYSIFGTIHQTNERFSYATRGKQTLANIVVANAMTDIYPLAEWSAAIIDSILICGDNYFTECLKKIVEPDYEFDTDDLLSNCTIYPYSFEVTLIPVVDGTMFILRTNQFNLYKALRVFFDYRDKRKGMICCDQGRKEKRFLGFGKIQEKEYYMFDCQCNGPPVFMEHRGTAYMLRCRTLKRLLYVITLTLRGGDFFIYEVDVANVKPTN
ncbi:hypothetical protein FQR65_LT15408 [Abscondita terminalis]|nr:hypothetical protein FQR65_LT15408 [Abscondita terminalis]